MPLSYWVDEQLGVFFMNCEGHVKAAELFGFVADRDTLAPEGIDTVVDLSGVTDLDLTAEQVGWLARGRRDRSRLALIAPRPLLLGISRMFQINAEVAGQRSEVRIFTNREDAVAWLRAERTRSAGS
jgi:hypothetical protein